MEGGVTGGGSLISVGKTKADSYRKGESSASVKRVVVVVVVFTAKRMDVKAGSCETFQHMQKDSQSYENNIFLVWNYDLN
ncbi:Hypothetical predicted protein [Octopus vulgaris]|uniref:Uncharacterized protein n=1 Tax=Octopus vulgaris TaxID=6645 RepID=A0AA36B2X0_OCTVU|nr:Hypothetical predicted protein [Octopus vulgaris]